MQCLWKNGKLYALGKTEVRIKPKDLPEWYLNAYISGKCGYISCKDVKDMVYEPNYITKRKNNDDTLYISFDKKIKIDENQRIAQYINYDVRLHGAAIHEYIKKAQKYCECDISKVVGEIKKKEKWYEEIKDKKLKDLFNKDKKGQWEYRY